MFIINYSYFEDHPFYSGFSISYMTGLRVMDMTYAKVAINVDSRTAFVYCE